MLYTTIPRFLLAVVLLLLAATQTLKQSVEMYTLTKQWQPNQYMQRLMTDGILYFIMCVSLFSSFHSHLSPLHPSFIHALMKLTTRMFPMDYQECAQQYLCCARRRAHNQQHFNNRRRVNFLHNHVSNDPPLHHQHTRAAWP